MNKVIKYQRIIYKYETDLEPIKRNSPLQKKKKEKIENIVLGDRVLTYNEILIKTRQNQETTVIKYERIIYRHEISI